MSQQGRGCTRSSTRTCAWLNRCPLGCPRREPNIRCELEAKSTTTKLVSWCLEWIGTESKRRRENSSPSVRRSGRQPEISLFIFVRFSLPESSPSVGRATSISVLRYCADAEAADENTHTKKRLPEDTQCQCHPSVDPSLPPFHAGSQKRRRNGMDGMPTEKKGEKRK